MNRIWTAETVSSTTEMNEVVGKDPFKEHLVRLVCPRIGCLGCILVFSSAVEFYSGADTRKRNEPSDRRLITMLL